MCSNPGERCAQPSGGTGQEDLDRLGDAIDELADAARGEAASAPELAGRLAEVWEMVAELDPELARRLAGYDS
jgi:ABC-type transporter Mla subunit MlaD